MKLSKLKILGLVFSILFSTSAFAKEVSAYFTGKLRSEAVVTKTLTDSGFEVIGSYALDKKGKFTTIIFTSAKQKELAKDKTRGFYAIGRVFINQKDEKIIIANPNYFGHAFLQDDYSKDVHNVTDKLLSAFGDLTPDENTMDSGDLDSYHFMFGMPYYEDMIIVAQGKNLETKIENPIFSLKIGNATLVGVELKKRTKKFVKKVGSNNGALLPYTVLIENGKAKILNPKYYLAISYPKLTMGDFTRIATVPDAIEKEITKLFN